jgi:hypothetical protein
MCFQRCVCNRAQSTRFDTNNQCGFDEVCNRPAVKRVMIGSLMLHNNRKNHFPPRIPHTEGIVKKPAFSKILTGEDGFFKQQIRTNEERVSCKGGNACSAPSCRQLIELAAKSARAATISHGLGVRAPLVSFLINQGDFVVSHA